MIITNKILLSAIMMLTAMLAASCGGDAVEMTIAEAEQALANGEYEVAQGLCDDLTDGSAHDDLRASQLGRLSIIYLKLDERADDGRNADMATRCYRAAYEVNADSARIFYSSLPTQDIALSETLRQLERPADGEGDVGVPEESEHMHETEE